MNHLSSSLPYDINLLCHPAKFDLALESDLTSLFFCSTWKRLYWFDLLVMRVSLCLCIDPPSLCSHLLLILPVYLPSVLHSMFNTLTFPSNYSSSSTWPSLNKSISLRLSLSWTLYLKDKLCSFSSLFYYFCLLICIIKYWGGLWVCIIAFLSLDPCPAVCLTRKEQCKTKSRTLKQVMNRLKAKKRSWIWLTKSTFKRFETE